MDRSQCGFGIFSGAGELLRANPIYLEAFSGQTNAGCIGKTHDDLVAAAQTTGWFVCREPVKAPGSLLKDRFEVMDLRTEAGRWFRLTATALENDLVLRELSDVTAERRARERGLKDKARSELFFEVSACMVLNLSLDGVIQDVNEWAGDLLSAPVCDLKTLHFVDELVAGDHKDLAERLLSAVLDTGEPSSEPLEFDLISPSGDRMILRWRGAPIRDAEGMIEGVVLAGVDITEHRMIEEQITFLASHDEVTGLPNRSLFMDRLNVAIAQARRESLWVAVLFIDLDGFKNVNDNLGHEAGDMLLQQVADRLVRRVRASDTVARFGGDEFAVVLAGLKNMGDGQSVASDILGELTRRFVVKQASVTISGSIGISYFPDDAEAPEDLIRLADGAMYSVKHGGKKGVKTARETVAI